MILLNLKKKGKEKMDYETENDILERKVNDLEDEVRRLGNDITDYMFECTELRNKLDDAEYELEKEIEEKERINGILDRHPDEIWKWFCDSFNLSYYEKEAVISKVNDLIENKLKKSTYYES